MKSFLLAQKAVRLSLLSNHLLQSRCHQSTVTTHARYYHTTTIKLLGANRRYCSGGGSEKLIELQINGPPMLTQTLEDSHSLLIRAGFVRQAHAGLFQFLPLGLRVQEKLEKLLDKHMTKLGSSFAIPSVWKLLELMSEEGASKLSLSTFSSEDLWEKTGRLDGSNSELFRLEDRKGGKFLLSPTHEEEITSLVGSIVKSYKELPLRLYQISRKYRDEPRPRQGLLRTREFLMKDLYTFDASIEEALETYTTVRQAYSAFFDEFKIPYLTAEASSGGIGGDLSHEYHFPSSKGEDNIISCDSCNYIANEELAKSKSTPALQQNQKSSELDFGTGLADPSKLLCNYWLGISKDHRTLLQAIFPSRVVLEAATGEPSRGTCINLHALKVSSPDLDLSVEDPLSVFEKNPKSQRSFSRVFDKRIPKALRDPRTLSLLRDENSREFLNDITGGLLHVSEELDLDLIKIATGDKCAACETGTLKVQSAVELGHTFHLGTRYSKPLEATVATDLSQTELPKSQKPESNCSDGTSPAVISEQTTIQMGCHGIGVSRLIAAVADSLADSKGLNWPSIMAPFQAVVIPTRGQENDAADVYDLLTASAERESIDTVLDDRNRSFGWKLNDADTIGYPVIVLVGRDWKDRKCEVQCRRLALKEIVAVEEIRGFVEAILKQL